MCSDLMINRDTRDFILKLYTYFKKFFQSSSVRSPLEALVQNCPSFFPVIALAMWWHFPGRIFSRAMKVENVPVLGRPFKTKDFKIFSPTTFYLLQQECNQLLHYIVSLDLANPFFCYCTMYFRFVFKIYLRFVNLKQV